MQVPSHLHLPHLPHIHTQNIHPQSVGAMILGREPMSDEAKELVKKTELERYIEKDCDRDPDGEIAR